MVVLKYLRSILLEILHLWSGF